MTESLEKLSDSAILEELGRRFSKNRIALELTQEAVAKLAGISKRTLERIENGKPSSSENLVRLLRVLGLLGALDAAVPNNDIRPLVLIRTKPKRKRVRISKSKSEKNWTWSDDQ